MMMMKIAIMKKMMVIDVIASAYASITLYS